MTNTLDRFRVAMRFSLWTWAAYWPAGGLLLIAGGLDPVSLAVVLGSFATFVLLLVTGVLKADASRTMKEFLVERPLYLIALVVVLALAAPFILPVADLGLALFATAYLGGIVLMGVRMALHLRTTGQGAFASRADQVFIVVGLTGFTSLLVFLDAWLPLFGGPTVGGSSTAVALANWVNLLYPPMLMLASRPFRAPMRWPRRGAVRDAVADAAAPAEVPAARLRKAPAPELRY